MMEDAICEMCKHWQVEAYYDGHGVCDLCVDGAIEEIGCQCPPHLHCGRGLCETPPSDETVARVVCDWIRDRNHARSEQGALAL